MIAWMMWATGITLMLGAAAAICERAARGRGLQVRGVWIAALAGSLGIQLASWLRPATTGPSTRMEELLAQAPVLLGDLVGQGAAPVSLFPWDTVLSAGWAIATAAALSYLATSPTRRPGHW